MVIDVRRYPRSKLPWFNREHLERELAEHGIGYSPYPELGALGIARHIEPFSDLNCIDSPTYRAYITYLLVDQNAFAKVREIANIASSERSKACLLCKERFPWRCHRYFLSDSLRAMGIDVVHIIDENRTYVHRGTRCYGYIAKRLLVT